MDDLLIILPATLLTGILAVLFELSWRKLIIPQWLARKFLHIAAVGACAIVPLYLNNLQLLSYLVLGFEVILVYLVGSGKLFAEKEGRKSWGIALFPIPYFVLLLLFENERILIFLPMIILAISDALACILGTVAARKHFNLSGDKKSIIGSSAFFISALVLLMSFWSYSEINLEFIITCSIISMVLSTLEALGSKGSDNFLVPSGAALLIYIEMHHPFAISEYLFLVASLLIFVLAVLKMRWLEISGALSAALLGFFVWRFAGWLFLVPLAWFLFSSSLIGRLLKSSHDSGFEKKHGKARDWVQVLSNSWLYLILAILAGILPAFSDSITPKLYAVMAIATADTWASEIGGKLSKNVLYLFNLKMHPKGISGGLSLAGTFAGLAGASSVAVIASLLGHVSTMNQVVLISIVGFCGMLLDSIIAAFFQKRHYNLELNQYSDEPKAGFSEKENYRILNNDQVNMLSISLALII